MIQVTGFCNLFFFIMSKCPWSHIINVKLSPFDLKSIDEVVNNFTIHRSKSLLSDANGLQWFKFLTLALFISWLGNIYILAWTLVSLKIINNDASLTRWEDWLMLSRREGFVCLSSTSLLLLTHLPSPFSLTRAQTCNPMDCSPPGSSVHGIFQARILEWVATSLSIAYC